MGCVNAKKTAFGRVHDYRICRCFQQTGRTRCQIGGDRSCPCFMDDGKEDCASPHSKEDLEYLAMQERIRSAVIGCKVRRMERQLAPFFDAALSQSPDGGMAYYDHENPLLPDLDNIAETMARIRFG